MLSEFGIEFIYHYSPIHYLPFIARSKKLASKPELILDGFESHHFRSTSHNQDIKRGFGEYVFMTNSFDAPILLAKLAKGFPHISYKIPALTLINKTYDLCRYNVAKTRYLKRDGKPGFKESAENGRYYDEKQIPIARTNSEKKSLLKAQLRNDRMIEILTPVQLELPDETEILCFSKSDFLMAKDICEELKSGWKLSCVSSPGPYPDKSQLKKGVGKFITNAMNDSGWSGDGLEFDSL